MKWAVKLYISLNRYYIVVNWIVPFGSPIQVMKQIFNVSTYYNYCIFCFDSLFNRLDLNY